MNPLDKGFSIDQKMAATRPIAEQKGERQRPRSGWLAITGLLILSALPVLGGVLRLRDGIAEPESEILLATSVAIVAHIVAMSVYCILGAFQFSPALRIRRGWHRTAGRALIPAGFIATLSSIWLAVFFDGPPDEFALAMIRLVFAVPMTVFLVLAVITITRRDFAAHGAWMTRAYAIAVSGGTQALVVTLWTLNVGEVNAFGEAWLVAAGFVINSAVAELLILRRTSRRRRGRARRGGPPAATGGESCRRGDDAGRRPAPLRPALSARVIRGGIPLASRGHVLVQVGAASDQLLASPR